MDEQRRQDMELISSLMADARWHAVTRELDRQEKAAFEAILQPGFTKEAIAGIVATIRRIRALPEHAADVLRNSKR